MTTSSRIESRKSIVTLVGAFSEDRVDLARGLIERGSAVLLCAGPPNCSLLRGDSCPLLEVADATVLLPNQVRDRKVATGLSRCAENASHCIVMEPSTVPVQGHAAHVRFAEMERMASFLTSMLSSSVRTGYAKEST
jgi:hypothetical protein